MFNPYICAYVYSVSVQIVSEHLEMSVNTLNFNLNFYSIL